MIFQRFGYELVVSVEKAVRKCTKKCDAGAKLLFFLLNLMVFEVLVAS